MKLGIENLNKSLYIWIYFSGNREVNYATPQSRVNIRRSAPGTSLTYSSYTSLTGAEVREVGEDAMPGHQEPTYANRFIPRGVAEDHHSSEVNVPEYQVFNDDKFQSAVQIGSTKSATVSQTVVYTNVIVYENLLTSDQITENNGQLNSEQADTVYE